jgi:hypothetical protein
MLSNQIRKAVRATQPIMLAITIVKMKLNIDILSHTMSSVSNSAEVNATRIKTITELLSGGQ